MSTRLPISPTSTPAPGPPTLLLVEDDADDILLMQRAFRKARVSTRLEVARDGEQALTYLTACQRAAGAGSDTTGSDTTQPMPLAILLDLKLPRKSGLEVLAWLRQQPGLKWLPVVVLTSSREQADLRHAYELGANSYLIKPVSFDALLEMMQVVSRYWLTLNEQPATVGS